MADKNVRLEIRISPEDRRQLSALMESWGETQSDAIRRAISMAYQMVNEENMRKCAICKKNEAIYLMQFVGEDTPSFYRPGFQIRGFSTTPICDNCRADVIARTQPEKGPRKTEPEQ